MSDYLICTQNIKNNEFGNEPSKAIYLRVPDNELVFLPKHKIEEKEFLSDIIDQKQENIIIFIHGYNSDDDVVIERHRTLKKGFQKAGFKGNLITFVWPSDDKPLLYLEDRHDAKVTALELVNSGIKLLVKQQNRDCTVNVHLIAHSTGAYVIKEAFEDAETTRSTSEMNWIVSQILFIGGDISSDSMRTERAQTIYAHCNRLTNYFNPYDSILAISNAKRVGFQNRVGRIGLPDDSPTKAIDINCGNHFNAHKDELKEVVKGALSHSWYFYSDAWYNDALATIMGNLDRNVIPTRELDRNNELFLKV